MEAFRQAVDVWRSDMLEMDVRLTRDGEVVVIHDPTVDRTTDGRGAVASMTFEELRSLDAGARFVDPAGEASYRGRGVRVPRFEEVLESFPDVRLNVEAKEPGVARGLVDLVRRHGAERRVLIAAEFERARDGARGYPGPWGASRHHVFWFWLLHRLPAGGPYTPAVDVLQVPESWHGLVLVTPRLVRRAHARNLPIHVWTVDDPGAMRRLLSWDVDAIQTDRPDVLARVLHDVAGRPLPPGLLGGA